MTVLITPPLDAEPWPTLGPQVAQLLEECAIYGPGSLKGEPARLTDEQRAILYRLYEVYPKGHPLAGRRRFKRGGVSWRKGMAKTEFLAWIAFAELHPEGPVRCDGFDAAGNPVGRPVRDPYIPLLAYSVEQVEELAYGALFVVCTEGPDADLFDCTKERIVRLAPSGAADGKAVPLSQSPNARDGARTTFQGFDEPHRLYLPRLREAHETMVANLEKRALEDPWGLYVGTAGEPGQGSIAEDLHEEAEAIERGEVDEPALFYFHRQASDGHDLSTIEGRVKAISEATGPTGEWGPGQFRSIARQWDRKGADLRYLERVWLNRWVASEAQAFDTPLWATLERPGRLRRGTPVAVGFDGARFHDSTGLVLTDLTTGTQEVWAVWERPLDADDWEVPEDEVTAAVADLMRHHKVFRLYADPPYWTETVGAWAGRWPGKVEEWWTNRRRPMAQAVRAYTEAMASGAVGWSKDHPLAADLSRHIAAAGRHDLKGVFDDDGKQLYVLKKLHPDRKFDLAMAGCLSWQAYLDALKTGANRPRRPARPRRIR